MQFSVMVVGKLVLACPLLSCVVLGSGESSLSAWNTRTELYDGHIEGVTVDGSTQHVFVGEGKVAGCYSSCQEWNRAPN